MAQVTVASSTGHSVPKLRRTNSPPTNRSPFANRRAPVASVVIRRSMGSPVSGLRKFHSPRIPTRRCRNSKNAVNPVPNSCVIDASLLKTSDSRLMVSVRSAEVNASPCSNRPTMPNCSMSCLISKNASVRGVLRKMRSAATPAFQRWSQVPYAANTEGMNRVLKALDV